MVSDSRVFPTSSRPAVRTVTVSRQRSDAKLVRVAEAAGIAAAAALIAIDIAFLRSAAVLVEVVLSAAAYRWVSARTDWSSTAAVRDVERALLPIAFALRAIVLAVSYPIQEAGGFLVVNSDAVNYLYWAREIASRLPERLYDVRAHNLAGTWDAGFHYILGFILWLSRGDLLAAHTVFVVCGCASVWLLWRIGRPLLAEHAVWPALALAISPLAIYLASVDLMKDSLLTAAFLLGIWAGQRVLGDRKRLGTALFALAVAFLLTRTIRYYIGLVLEVGLVLTPLALLARDRLLRRLRGSAGGFAPKSSFRPRRLFAVIAVFAACEIGLFAAGEPFTIQELGTNVRWVQRQSHAFWGPRGRIEKRFAGLNGRTGEPPGSELDGSRAEDGPAGPRTLTGYAFELLRKIYGPFLWAPPTGDATFEFFIGNWPAYFDSVLWYAAMPFGLYGVWRLMRQDAWEGWFIAASILGLFALIFVFKVTHRQRSSNLMPLLLIAAATGWLSARPRLRRAIVRTQIGIVLTLAIGYWSARLLLS